MASISDDPNSRGEDPKAFNLIVGAKTYPINYTIIGGEITNMAAQSSGLVINFSSSSSTYAAVGSSSGGSTSNNNIDTSQILLAIDLSRDLIDSIDVQKGGADKPFVVMSSNEQVIDSVVEREKNVISRILVIGFNYSPENWDSVQIQGTKMSP